MRNKSESNLLYRIAAGHVWLLVGVLVVVLPGRVRAAEAAPFTAYVSGKAEVVVSHDSADYFRFDTSVWGPNWAWANFKGDSKNEAGAAVCQMTATVGGPRPEPKKAKAKTKAATGAAVTSEATTLRLDFRGARTGPNQLRLNYELRAEKDADLTLVAITVAPATIFQGTDVLVEADGKQTKALYPFGRISLGEKVSVLRLTDPAGSQSVLRFDPPCEITTDKTARAVLAKDHLKADAPRRLSITVELPAPTAWYASAAEIPTQPGFDNWYPWKATGAGADSLLSMTDWLEKPAGKHGRITHEGEHLMYHDQPMKLWGINLCYAACAPQKTEADNRAAFYARYGINAVRLHKFAAGPGWDGIQSKESAAEYDPAKLDLMDYQVAKFKEAGIYVELSAHFGTVPMGPADRRDVPYMDEFGPLSAKNNRVTAPASAFYYSPELQTLHTRQIVNLLGHRNPYTGLTYAEDPAICILETINEQSVLFFTSMMPLKQSATLRQRVGQRFSEWLEKKYGNSAGLLKAWGANAFNSFKKEGFDADENLAKGNILPLGNPFYWDPDQLDTSPLKRRLLDTLQFLYALQCEAYDRYVAAVRQAGYSGEITASNWQAGRAYSHYANLHSDARVGMIDRHNYFGGGTRSGLGKFRDNSMLARAGSGSLSSGLQQVEGLPFMLSEWIHVFPNEWGAEGPAIIGAYGLGLQGWDASFMFQNKDEGTFSEELRALWDVMTPQVLGLFPAVARQVLRGDVQESKVVSVRSVHMPSLLEGRLGFDERVKQGYDDKEMEGAQVPSRALAAVRCVVQFTNRYETTPALDLKPYEQDGAVVSSTKQLRWQEGRSRTDGFFTLNTEATKAVVGFAQDHICKLDTVTIVPQSHFAAIYISAPEKQGKLATSRHLLITALARTRNTGMKFNLAGNEVLEKGESPLLLEPVKATVAITARRVASVRLLDHDGRPTGKTLPVANGQFTLDGTADKTPYYDVTVE